MRFWNKDQPKKPALLIVLVIGAAVLLLGFVIYKILTPSINSDTYQLLRVESGESYVGKLTHAGGDYVQLNDVYVYEAASGAGSQNAGQPNSVRVDDLTLIPVSSIKGTMYVSRDKIVYWGNLAGEGPIVNAIKSNHNKQN